MVAIKGDTRSLDNGTHDFHSKFLGGPFRGCFGIVEKKMEATI